jgi:hypothetical protein
LVLKASEIGDKSPTLIKEGVQYQYGFALTKERVMHEWLFVNDEQWLSQ